MELVLCKPELWVLPSVYADVLLVVLDPGNLVWVEASQAIYSVASSAWVNWIKSSGLMVGAGWHASSLPPKDQAIWWSVGPLLYLDIYLSASHPSLLETWQDLEGRVAAEMDRTPLVPFPVEEGAGAQPSGPVHALAMAQHSEHGPGYPGLSPEISSGVLLSRTTLDLWGGSVSSPGVGGQGLLCLCSQGQVFCLQVLQRLLYDTGSLARGMFAHTFLHCL